MVEKNEMFEKTLNKNYGTVQKKEIKVAELKGKLAKDFSSNTASATKTLNKELKSHQTLDKGIKTKYIGNLKELKANHLTHKKDIDSRVKHFEVEYQKELKSSAIKFDAANKVLNDLVADLNKNNEVLTKDVNDKFVKDIATSEKEKVNIETKGEKDVSNLVAELKETQEKYETLVVTLNEKRDTKAEKLNAALVKKAEKFTVEVEKEQLKTDKVLADLVPPFEEKLADIDEKILKERHRFQNKESAIKSALDSRVARHEKFLNKAIAQGDNKSTKEHRKNIASLEKEADKELRLLTKEHEDRHGILSNKKKDFLTTELNKTSAIRVEFVKFKEDKLYQIASCKATLANDLQTSVIGTKQQLEDELNKYNEYFANNDRNQAEVIKLKDLDLEKQDDIQVALKIMFDKTNQTNDVKHQEALSVKDSEFEATNQLKATEEILAKIALDVELAKLESEREVADIELTQAIKVNEENELIEYHNNDFNKQASVNAEYLKHQSEYSNLFTVRAQAISEFEELEINNRADLKLAFLEKHRVLVLKDFEAISNKINQVFEAEKVMFEVEINKRAKGALEELEKYETESAEEITAIVDKRNALNPRAYKKEIKVLDREISDKKDDQLDELDKLKAAINAKTAVYNKGLEQAEVRKFTALNEVTSINNAEQSNLDKAVELVTEERNNELNDIQERVSTTTTSANNYYTQAEARDNSAKEENTTYQNTRVEKEDGIIKDIKDVFEQDKHGLSTQLEQSLSNLESQKSNTNEEANDNKLKEEESLESKVRGYDNQIVNFNEAANKLIADQGDTNRTNIGKLDTKYNNHLTRVSNELKVKAENYRVKTVEVDKAEKEESRSFDTAKKQAQKNYDSALEKGLSIINQKLQQDLRNI